MFQAFSPFAVPQSIRLSFIDSGLKAFLSAGNSSNIEVSEPKALTKLDLNKNHSTTGVKGIGSGYWRVVGELEELIDKAKEISQRTLFGIGFARILNKI